MILKAALAHAAFAGRREISPDDILRAAELALPHRLKRQPFQETELERGEIEERLAQIVEQCAAGAQDLAIPAGRQPEEKKTP